jgi:MerR family transcriptional regulator, Zn(II)-responsive regulator of zntA
MVQSNSNTLLPGAVAEAAGVSPDTIRHYERIGVLPRTVRNKSGYRLYPPSAVSRVMLVQRAIRLGFTLAELAEVLQVRDNGGVPCCRVYRLTQEKLKSVEADIQALMETKRYLKKILSDWEALIRRTRSGRRSYLLDSISPVLKKPRVPEKFRRKKTI